MLVLVIEDESELLEEIASILQFEGYEVIGATNGDDGLKRAVSQRPDVILCDIRMPGRDGFSVIQELRANTMAGRPIFIFLTARAQRTDVRRGMELGADDYITKPFTPTELLNAIETQVRKRKQTEVLVSEQIEAFREQILLALPHEMRTTLTAILGFSEILQQDALRLGPAEVSEYGGQIHFAATQLRRIVENYLSYVQIEAIAKSPQLLDQLRRSTCDAPVSSATTRAMLIAQEQSRDADLRLEQCNEMPVTIGCPYLEKIVEELVRNALKFSDKGKPVTLTTEIHEGSFILSVKDQGIGMKPEQIAAIGAYVQFERRVMEQQGVGLGLMIAKRLAELHGGILSVESEAGVGTEVVLVLPLR